MTQRRSFIKQTTAAAAGTLLFSTTGMAALFKDINTQRKLGLQLFTFSM